MSNPLETVEKLDTKLFEAINNNRAMAFSEGALSSKHKLLIGIAVDAVLHSEKGVRALTETALKAGATKEEITEALRVAYFIGGVGAAFVSAEAIKDLF